MSRYEHLVLPEFKGDLSRKKREKVVINYKDLYGRDKKNYYDNVNKGKTNILNSIGDIKRKYKGKINPNLIFKIKVNQPVSADVFDKKVLHSMGIDVINIADNKKGYWIVFSDDSELSRFQEKLAQYSGIKEGHKYEFFNAIDGIYNIEPSEKIGAMLKNNPIGDDDIAYVNLEVWRMDDTQLYDFMDKLALIYNDRNTFKICDKYITDSIALYRVKASGAVISDLLEFKEIAWIDRPMQPNVKFKPIVNIDIDESNVEGPDNDATGILVLDSGIINNHPLIEKALGASENFQNGEKATHDTVGHGTKVSGCALYGDIEKCVEENSFKASNRLFSGKIMYSNEYAPNQFQAVYDNEKLIENELKESIEYFLNNKGYKIKVVNLSIGNEYEVWGQGYLKQFPLASLIDDLAYEYSDVVFIVSAGNISGIVNEFNSIDDMKHSYPEYYFNDDKYKIINPATAALALTVGSVANSFRLRQSPFNNSDEELWQAIARENEPSPFSRCGFGVNGMIKPELVDVGGNIIAKEQYGRVVENIGGKVQVLSNKPIESLFTYDYGTSFAAPKVANIVGQIANKYPDKSANFIKNLVLLSSEYKASPKFIGTKAVTIQKKLKLQGYGIPNLEKALYSHDNSVVLFNEEKIKVDSVKVFSLNLPKEFFDTKGYKKLIVTLMYNPPTKNSRGDSYLGNSLQFKLFHTISPLELVEKFSTINDIDINEENLVPKEFKKYEIDLLPGPTIRNKGCHQKAVKEFKRDGSKVYKAPLSLVLFNINKWIPDDEFEQDYCISVVLEHSEDIQLYNKVQAQVRTRIRNRG